MKNKIAFFNRHAPHYRKGIYIEMDKKLEIDFYFGDKRPGKIRKLEYNYLKNFKYELKNINIGPFYWQKGIFKILFEPYKYYITSGDFYCISTWLFLLLSKLTNKKVFFWTHGIYGKESFLIKKIKLFYFSLTSGLFLYGEYAKNLLIKEGVKEKKLFVIYNSLDYKSQLNLRNQNFKTDIYYNKFENNYYNFIFIGRLTKIKSINQIIDAINLLRDKSFFANITIIGDGEMKDELIKLSKKYNLENNIWFYGPCYDENQLAELIFNADLCISPGNVGLTAIHSLTYGTPVITHNNLAKQMPEFEAINERITGSFFKENNIESLSKCILNWFSDSYDRSLIRENCYKIIDSKYNPNFQIQIFNTVLK